MRVKMRIPVDCKEYYESLIQTNRDTVTLELCYYISWRGKVIKSWEYHGELFEVEVVPSVRLKHVLDRIYDTIDDGYFEEERG